MHRPQPAYDRALSGTAYFAPVWRERPAPLCAARYKQGHLQSVRYFGKPIEAVGALASPDAALIYFLTEKQAFCWNRAAQTVRPLPYRDDGWQAFCADHSRVLYPNFVSKGAKDGYGYGAARTDTGRELWREICASPFWSVSGNQLIFARYIHGNGYWSALEFPPAFFKQNRAYRRRCTHWFAADFTNPNTTPPVRRISEKEAAHLVGGWFPAFLHLHIDNAHNALCRPDKHQILPAPRGNGVIIRISKPPPTFYDVGTKNPLPPSADDSANVGNWTIYADRHGRTKRYENVEMAFTNWSQDALHLYGFQAEGAGDDEPKYLCRFHVLTGTTYKTLLPKGLGMLTAFVPVVPDAG